MKVELSDVSSCRKKINVTLDPEKVKQSYQNIFKKYATHGDVQGFRKGKVPSNLIENKYGPAIVEELTDQLLKGTVYQILKENNIEPVVSPMAENIKSDLKTFTFSYTLLVDVKPEIKLKEYKGLKLEKEILPVTEDEIKKSLDKLRENYGTYKPIEARSAAKGDYCVADFRIEVGEKILRTQKDAWFCLEDAGLLPGAADAIVGMNIGETKDISVTIPEDFFDKEYVGQKALFIVSLKELKEKTLPVLDDDFAKDLGTESLDHLKKMVQTQLESYAQEHSKKKLEEDILKILLSENDFEMPETLIDYNAHYMVHETIDNLKSRGLKEPEIKQKEQEIKDMCHKRAKEVVKIQFIFDEIAEKEKIKVEKEEIEKKVEEMAKWMKKGKEELLKDMDEKGSLARVYGEIKREKVFDFLIKEAKIKEIKSCHCEK